MTPSESAENGRHLPADHPRVNFGKTGLLLVNLGTPDGTDFWNMRRYLKEFLWDRRVIETPRILWWLILNGIILNTRPQKSGEAYRRVWNEELDESPLRTFTRSQSDQLAEKLQHHQNLVVSWAMRYGNPSIDSKLTELQQAGCERIVVLPLYPQYSAATTATVADKVFDSLKKMRWQPAIRIAAAYHDDDWYIDAICASIKQHLATQDFEPERILLSFHGVPKAYLDKGDPYHCHCVKTWRLVGERLGMGPDKLFYAFQSRFGPAEWLQPYTDETLEEWAKSGVKRVTVAMPGFSSDCLETIDEMGLENRELFEENGGTDYEIVPCLNDSELGMQVIEQLAKRELAGWVAL